MFTLSLLVQVQWDDGITAAGSSGSPLLSTTTKRIIGQLRAGGSFCPDETDLPDTYGKFSIAYEQGLGNVRIYILSEERGREGRGDRIIFYFLHT